MKKQTKELLQFIRFKFPKIINCECTHTGKHYKLKIATKNKEAIVFTSATPSDFRARRKVVTDIRHALGEVG